MNIGVAYYPEYNKEENWEKHLKMISDTGIKRIRFGEFAWSYIEPEEGVYNWEWLDKSISMAADYDIEVILGTPTACPPIWLVEKHPEVLPVNNKGRRTGFGARQHRCFNSPEYLKYAAIITGKLGERYGKHPNVAAWQIDNELGGEQKKCYCNNCRKEFQKYLAGKYQSIEELNRRWGNHFWSQDYQNWSQIPVPMKFASDMEMKHHPGLELEFVRFSSRSIIKFASEQAKILRKYSDKIITTNHDNFTYGDNVNLSDLYKCMDIGAVDIYSEKLHEISFYSELTRSLKGNDFWIMEYGTGSTDLYNEMKMIKEKGCSWFNFFTFIPFTAGQEQGHKGLFSITEQPEPNYYTVQKWIAETENNCNKPADKPDVGLFYSFDSSWVYYLSEGYWIDDLVKKQIYPRYMIDLLYKGIFEENISAEILFKCKDIENTNLDMIILPWQIIHNEKLELALIKYVKKGGKLVVTSDLFRKNGDNVYLKKPPRIYKELLNWFKGDFIDEEKIEDPILRYFNLLKGHIWMVKRKLTIAEWRDILAMTISK